MKQKWSDMKKPCLIFLLLLFLSAISTPAFVNAQSYSFEVPFQEVQVYIEEDGTLSIQYIIEFQNQPNAPAIEYVDIGMPNRTYNLNNIQAYIDGFAITEIESSDFAPNAFVLVLGDQSIQSGQNGTINVWIPGVEDVLYSTDIDDQDYVGLEFTPNWFDSAYDRSTATEYAFTVILPPGVGNDEGIYFSPENWPGSQEPTEIGRSAAEDRIYYFWFTDNANLHTEYRFGAAFPNQYIPAESLAERNPETETTGPNNRSSFPIWLKSEDYPIRLYILIFRMVISAIF
jgi:hypothetical protein